MKRTLLLIMCVLASLAMPAQKELTVEDTHTSYHPFLKEGKVWNYQEYYHNVWDDERWTKEVSYVINGTTETDGKTYYKMYRISEDGNNYYCALREENRKVWQYTSNEGDHLLYDFGMSVGDSYTPTYEPFLFQLTSIKPMWFHDDQLLNVFFYDMLEQYDPTEPPINFAPVPFIEGVGCENGWNIVEFYAAQPTNGIIYGERFLSCYEDGKCIFKADDFNNLTTDDNNTDSDYLPLVKEDKRWNVFRSDFDSGCHLEQYMLGNEGIVKDGKTYMKMSRSEDDLDVIYDEGLLREEDRKVYIYDAERQEEHLMFDYSLKAGDTYETYSYDEQRMVTYKVLSVSDYQEGPEVIRYDYNQEGSLIKHHRYLKKWTVCRTDNEFLQKTWVEGVGSLEGPLGNLRDVVLPDMCWDYLGYVDDNYGSIYLPFSFHDTWNRQVYGCDLPTGADNNEEYDGHHKLNYELEGDRLHIYGEVYTNCGPNDYAYFYEKPTDNPLVHKIEFEIQEVEVTMNCMALQATDFYVPGFDPNLNYIIVDNQGEEHQVIKKTAQMAYRPFVEDGKVWKVSVTWSSNPVQVVEHFYFAGDTIIDGRTCKQMMCQRYVSPDYPYYYNSQSPSLSYVGAWYEEDKKVYEYDAMSQQFKLMYDFSLDGNDTIQIDNNPYLYVIGPRQTGGINGFKGVYRKVSQLADGEKIYQCAPWLEGVGIIYGHPATNVFNVELADPSRFLMSCTVGDEVIYLNDEYEDGATPEALNARKRIDFTHTIKTKPKMPRRSMGARASSPAEEGQLLYGEYSNLKLGINLNPLADAYVVRITDETGKAVYEKNVNAASIVGLNIDISAYPAGRYTVTVENSQESFTGVFETVTTGISDALRLNDNVEMINSHIYNLQGQRIRSLQKGLNIVNGQKVYVK